MENTICLADLRGSYSLLEQQTLDACMARRTEIRVEIISNLHSYNPNFQNLTKEGRSVERTINKILRKRGLVLKKNPVFYLPSRREEDDEDAYADFQSWDNND